MSGISKTLIIFVASLLSVACGASDGFTIDCEINGLDDHGLEMIYATDRGLSHTSHHPVGGKVELHGSSVDPTLVDIFSLDGELLASLVMRNGEKARLTMTLGDPLSLKIDGQPASRDYAAFVVDNDSLLRRGSAAQINSLIASYVRANPSSMASTMLLVTRFVTDGHELLADSLLSAIDAAARPRLLTGAWATALGEQVSSDARGEMKSFTLRMARDTFARYTPGLQGYALMVISDGVKPDSDVAALKALRRDLSRRRLMMMEISIAPDSVTWRANIAPDSAVAVPERVVATTDSLTTDSVAVTQVVSASKPSLPRGKRVVPGSSAATSASKSTKKLKAPEWIQAWAPGGVASPRLRRLAIPRTPYYIIADSTATVRYRGSSLAEADSFLRSVIIPPALDGEKK